MRRSRRPLVIASRRSRLARAQAQIVARMLCRLTPNLEIQYHWVESEADQQPDIPLAHLGGKGLFARALYRALRVRQAHLAVHSLKDLPVVDADGAERLIIAAVPPRADVRDCLIAPSQVRNIDHLPPNATVGTASPRRAAQLLRLRPDLSIQLMRGNIDTRLRKVLEGRRCDATLLAAAGLQRAGLGDYADRPIDTDLILPAAGQGALAIQCRVDDHATLTRCLGLNDPVTAQAVYAERRVVAGLGGDCHSAIAVLAQPLPTTDPNTPAGAYYRLRVRLLSPDGRQALTFDRTSAAAQLTRLADDAIDSLRNQGAHIILATQ